MTDLEVNGVHKFGHPLIEEILSQHTKYCVIFQVLAI